MAEPIRRPEPLPNQQPEPDEIELLRSRAVVVGTPAVLDPDRELPETASEGRGTGKVVEWRRSAGEKLEQAKESASEAVEDAVSRASVAYNETEEKVARWYDETSRRAARMLRTAEHRARFYASHYPMKVIAGAAAAGFVTGVVLRIWRSSRYESRNLHRS